MGTRTEPPFCAERAGSDSRERGQGGGGWPRRPPTTWFTVLVRLSTGSTPVGGAMGGMVGGTIGGMGGGTKGGAVVGGGGCVVGEGDVVDGGRVVLVEAV